MKSIKMYVAILAIALTAACAQLGVPTPQTFNQKLAVSVVTVTEVRNTAATLLVAGKISPEDAANINKQADVAREGLNVARGLSATDIDSAGGRLEAATAALRALQTYLISKGTK